MLFRSDNDQQFDLEPPMANSNEDFLDGLDLLKYEEEIAQMSSIYPDVKHLDKETQKQVKAVFTEFKDVLATKEKTTGLFRYAEFGIEQMDITDNPNLIQKDRKIDLDRSAKCRDKVNKMIQKGFLIPTQVEMRACANWVLVRKPDSALGLRESSKSEKFQQIGRAHV